MFDIFFLSYDESNAEENWQQLIRRFSRAKRLHGVRGVRQAHAAMAQVSQTDFYFVIDADNQVHKDFDFHLEFEPRKDSLYVWRALNPVNQLVYGYGGIKLYNRFLFSQKINSSHSPDVATTIAPKYVPVMKLASTTYFNNTPLEAWRGSFRECTKLTLNLLKNPADHHSEQRLNSWLHSGKDEKNGHWCLLGAQQGQQFALREKNNSAQLERINNFELLNKLFHEQQQVASPQNLGL